jgi:hypothetical protein
LITAPLMMMNVSSWWNIGGYLLHCCCTNSQQVHRGFLAGGKKTHNRSIWMSVFKPLDVHGRYPQQGRRWGSPWSGTWRYTWGHKTQDLYRFG